MALPAEAQVIQTGEKVEVTGSNIKRPDTETASPVQVITRKEIERTGAANVNEVLQQITSAAGGIDDRSTNGFAPGGGGLNLRGLGYNSTLVLINGRRVPIYPFALQGGSPQGFNDLQSIPLAAVDRIEILKDGASAIYGADAVAGVVNVILRQDYTGLEVEGMAGQTSHSADGKTHTASLTAGFGSMASDRYNVLIGANYSNRAEIPSRNRSYASTEDLRLRGGSDRRSGYGDPGTFTDLVTGDQLFGSGCGPSSQVGGSSIDSGTCRYDRPQYSSLLPASKKFGFYTRVNVELAPTLTLFAEGLATRNRYSNTGWPAASSDDVGIGSNIIPAGTPGNPFPDDAYAQYRFSDVGLRTDRGSTDTRHVLLGLKGTLAGWDWESGLNLNRTANEDIGTNNPLNSRVLCLTNPQAAAAYAAGGDPLGNGTLDQIFAGNPGTAAYFRNALAQCGAAFARYGYYNYANPAANTAGTAAYLRHDSSRVGRSTLGSVDFKASRELLPLPGGPLSVAFGFEGRRETVSDTPDMELQTGDTLSISATQAYGQRKVVAAHTELDAPLTREWTVDAAVRYDRYTGNGEFAKASPKIGVRFQPSANLLLRGSASTAFRAPSLFETSPAQQTAFAFGIQDPVLCPDYAQADTNPNCALDVRQVQRGNTHLKPEKSRVFTAGFVAQATDGVTLSVDGWKVSRRDEIGGFGDQTLVDLFPNDPTIVVRNAQGQIVQVNQVPVQLNKTSTWGIDNTLSLRRNLGDLGRLASRFDFSYVGSYRFSTVDATGSQVQQEFNGTYGQPRFRTAWDFSLARGAFEYSISGYGVGGYQGVGNTTKVSAFEVWNVGVVYTGIKNARIRLGINNLFDKPPPFDDESSGSTAGYNPQFGDPVGRLYTITVSYKFL